MPPQHRDHFRSTLGAVMATSGVAIGLGNVWRFPYMMGQFGGAAFLLLYLALILAFGVPALMAEWALGRHTNSGPWGAYQAVNMPFAKPISAIVVITIVMASSYYAVVIAQVLQHAFAFTFARDVTSPDAVLGGFAPQFGATAIVVAAACLILALGVRSGIERVSTIGVPLFFILFIILIVRSLTLPGAAEGLRVFFVPRWSQLTGTTMLAALGQATFSIGLGGAVMVLYGSYMRKRDSIPRGAILTVAADSAAALMAGLVIVPAVVALDIDLASGPSLMFKAMPQVFNQMPTGRLFGVLFFLSVFVVAMLSLIAPYEVAVVTLRKSLGLRRSRALAIIFIAETLLAIPAILSEEYFAISDLIWGTTMMTLGAALAAVAFGWCLSRSDALRELRANSTLPIPAWLILWIRFVIPAAILVILTYALYDILSPGKDPPDTQAQQQSRQQTQPQGP